MAILKLIFAWKMNPLLANTEVFDARIEALAEPFGVRFRAGERPVFAALVEREAADMKCFVRRRF
jgi:hypothetical protein